MTCVSFSTYTRQKGHIRSLTGKPSYRPVSSRSGATPQRNLAKADRWHLGTINLQQSSVWYVRLNNLYVVARIARSAIITVHSCMPLVCERVHHSFRQKVIRVLTAESSFHVNKIWTVSATEMFRNPEIPILTSCTTFASTEVENAFINSIIRRIDITRPLIAYTLMNVGSQRISPATAADGVYFPVPKSYLWAFKWTASMQENWRVPHMAALYAVTGHTNESNNLV